MALGVCLFFVIDGALQSTSVSVRDLLSLGFGKTDPLTFVNGWGVTSSGLGGFLSNTFIANAPQVILSAIYFTYNSIFTSFMLGVEWDHFSRHRKGLRVSSKPEGAQRSTYFLQLPYRVAVPLMILSGTLHWLTALSIFVVSITELPGPYIPLFSTSREYLTCGFSLPPMIAVMCLGILMICAMVSTGRMRLYGCMPIASSCSAAISAACHVIDAERALLLGPEIAKWSSEMSLKSTRALEAEITGGAACLPLQWGDNCGDIDFSADNTVRHCAFSSGKVCLPKEGVRYS